MKWNMSEWKWGKDGSDMKTMQQQPTKKPPIISQQIKSRNHRIKKVLNKVYLHHYLVFSYVNTEKFFTANVQVFNPFKNTLNDSVSQGCLEDYHMVRFI